MSFNILISLLCLLFRLMLSAATEEDPIDFLNEDSVVVITGAAGFLGSELALALHRTYKPKKILCIDRMGDHPENQEQLAFFEFQRQRAFHVLQTLGPKGHFYRVDFRPMIPEYFDLGEVPVLDHIFREHPDITHIVHLADPYSDSALQIVPREKDVPKSGMMEALMEQVLKQIREGKRAPHITYASSYEVYSFDPTSAPLVETQPIGTPSSLRGASKLIDEVIAKMYYDMYEVYSVGLRLFSVYGPWSVPGSALYEMAERTVMGNLPVEDDPEWAHIRDYLYIDDAIDGIMAAMQFRYKHPVIFNVASGEGNSLQSVAKIMEEYFPRTEEAADMQDTTNSGPVTPTVAVGSIERSHQILGFQPQVSLHDGIVKLLAWHYDRAFPYGGKQNVDEKSNVISNAGIVSCMTNDKECLKATPVFPCASECSHEEQCTPTFYDDIIGWTQSLTAACETVLYTVNLDETLSSLASAHIKIQSTSQSFLKENCNLAFVSKSSRLVQSLSISNRMTSFMGGRDVLLKHGEWTLIPVNAPVVSSIDPAVLLLPKLSPSLFFGTATKRAIYCDPDVLLDNISVLLREASMQPYSDEIEGATAMLIGKGKPKEYFADEDDFIPQEQKLDSPESIVQNSAYRMVRIAVSDSRFGDGFVELLDSSWMVHTLKSDDSRLFRCDVYGEVVQWEVSSDKSALEFVLGLHDMWSGVIVNESGMDPWWIGDGVVTVPEGQTNHRRLDEDLAIPQDDEVSKSEEEKEDLPEAVLQSDDETQSEDVDGAQEENHGDFVNEGVRQHEVVAAGDKQRGASSEQDFDDDQTILDGERNPQILLEGQDFSSYDTWMGVLSASSVKYFVRIVPSSEVGVVSLEDYDKQKTSYELLRNS